MSHHEGPGHKQKKQKVKDDAPDWYIQMHRSYLQYGLGIVCMDINGEVKFIDPHDFPKLIPDLIKAMEKLNDQI